MVRYTGTPEKALLERSQSNIISSSEIIVKQITPTTRDGAGNGQRGRLANIREPRGSKDSVLEADIKSGVAGAREWMQYDLEMSPRFQDIRTLSH
jgi:hypothetical protein